MERIQQAPPPSRHGESLLTVLYVEDEQENWDVVEQRLSRKYVLVRAANDEQMCRIVRERGRSLHAILMDIRLSGSRLDGIQLAQLIRGRLRGELPGYATELPQLDTPIFFLTAYADRRPPEELLSTGADNFITKPVDFVKLSLALANASVTRVMSSLRK